LFLILRFLFILKFRVELLVWFVFIIFGVVLMILCDLIFVLNKKEIEIELMKRNGLYLV
jgi:hypothetical protein